MTEGEWLACADPVTMFDWLWGAGKAPLYKVRRLFAACCRRIQADPMLTRIEETEPHHKEEDRGTSAPNSDSYDPIAFTDYGFVLHPAAHEALRTLARGKTEAAATVRLLRDIFGNPFRPVSLPPAFLQSKDNAVVRVAEAIYYDRAFDRLPALADALERAGCDNYEILNHCREPGPHVRGCWVVDLLLGRE